MNSNMTSLLTPSFRVFPSAVLSMILLLGLSGCGESKSASGAPAAGKPGPGGPAGAGAPPPARIAALILAPSLSGSAGATVPGNVLAEQQIDVQTEISGKVAEIGFREGEPVKAGQLLVRLDDTELKARLQQADANLMLAKTREERLRQDLKAQAVSQGEYDQVVAELRTAQGGAALARAQWEKTHLRAAFGGVVGLREVELGSVVQPGARVTTLQNLKTLRVEFTVPEKQADAIRNGMKVRFTAAGSIDTLEATVYAVESRIDSDTRLLRVRARCTAPKGRVLPGSFARVELPVRTDASLWLPAQAVVQSARGSQAWRVRGGIAEPVVFIPGVRDAQNVEVLSGLEAGDTILVSGLMQLRPATPVVPVVTGAGQ
jgi:membrane fusion protein (multidrug efflux system)